MAALFLPDDTSLPSNPQHAPGHQRPHGRPQLTVIVGGRSGSAGAARVAPRPLRLDRRVYLVRRLAVAALAVLVAVGLTLAVSAIVGAGPGAASPAVPATYQVQPGDTLWSIASSLPADGDLRDVVAELADANGGSSVRAGQRLSIPADLRS